jgi:DNA-binding transcriptional ArsR family regulator
VSNIKQKNGPEAAELPLTLVPSGPSAVLSDEAVAVIDVTTESEQRILAALWQSFGSNEATSTQLFKVSELTDRTYYRSLKSLADKGKLLKREVGRSTYYRLQPEQEEGLFDE